jgi:hypothetical protein
MNTLLTLLTARSRFVSPFLSKDGDPVALRTTEDIRTARAFLRLDDPNDDYPVVAALALLEGIGRPLVSSLLGAKLDLDSVTYSPAAFRPVPAQLHGGLLLPTYDSAPRLGISAESWPPVEEYRITAINENTARWEGGDGAQRMISAQVSNGIVKLAWPVPTISGWVRPSTPWEVGSMLVVSGKPIRFPHGPLDQALNAQRWAEKLVDQAGLAGHRQAQLDAAERNAIVFASLAYAAWKENQEAFA